MKYRTKGFQSADLFTANDVMDRLNKEYETCISSIEITGLDIPDTQASPVNLFTVIVDVWDINHYHWSFEMKIDPRYPIGYIYHCIYSVMADKLRKEDKR